MLTIYKKRFSRVFDEVIISNYWRTDYIVKAISYAIVIGKQISNH